MNVSITNIHLQIASLQGSVFDALGAGASGKKGANFADVLGNCCASGGGGRNSALRDPESGYRMMSRINQYEALFKGQHAELSALGKGVAGMADAGKTLGEVDAGMTEDEIIARLQTFIDRYNTWEDRFDDSVADGGVLDNVQAAEISLYELEQSVKSIFFGAGEGFSGLADLGIRIDPASHQATLDVGQFRSALASNKTGVANTLDEFSANFARSAEMLNEKDNFIPRQLENRSRAIGYIADHRQSLTQEFGSGDAARPTGDLTRALAAYNSTFGIG